MYPTDTKLLISELERIAASEAIGKSKDTKNAYKLMIGRLGKFLSHEGKSELRLQEFNEDRAQEFKEYLVETMELSNVSVNCTIQPIKQFLECLFMAKKIPVNPFYNVKYLPKHRGSTFIAFDQDEKERIAKHLRANCPELYLFSNMIYSCFIRPKELCALTAKDIDIKKEFIQVRVETSKVSHTSFLQIMPALKKLMLDYGILSFPSNQPIFKNICGEDNNLRSRRRRVTDLWKEEIKQRLKIDKEMYGLKHTGNIDYLKSLDNIGEANLLWLK